MCPVLSPLPHVQHWQQSVCAFFSRHRQTANTGHKYVFMFPGRAVLSPLSNVQHSVPSLLLKVQHQTQLSTNSYCAPRALATVERPTLATYIRYFGVRPVLSPLSNVQHWQQSLFIWCAPRSLATVERPTLASFYYSICVRPVPSPLSNVQHWQDISNTREFFS